MMKVVAWMKLARAIREEFETEGYLSKTLDDEAGREWRKDRNEYVEALIAANLEPAKKALLGAVSDEKGDSIAEALRAHAAWLLTVPGHDKESLIEVSEVFSALADRIDTALTMFEDVGEADVEETRRTIGGRTKIDLGCLHPACGRRARKRFEAERARDIHDMPAPEDYMPAFPGEAKPTPGARIVKEIVQKALEETNTIAPEGYVIVSGDRLASITSAKLAPVREVLKAIEYLVIADDIALAYVRSALALFEEEKS